MDYEPFKDLPGVKNMFMTERGSTYALFDNQTSQRNRSGERHEDKSVGLQPRSGKTIFLDLDSMNRIGSVFQREDMATRFVPVLDKDGKPTGKAKLELMQDYTYKPILRQQGSKFEMGEPKTIKAGTVLSEVPYSTKPVKGMYPIEIMRSESPLGEKGRGIHFGSRITEVLEKLDKQIQRGQAAVERGAARGGGAYGGAMPSLENTTFQQYMKMNRGGFVERQDPKAGNWKFI